MMFGTFIGGLVSLVIVSLVELACKVPIPECPVLSALNSVIASLDLTSPTIILSGRCLNEFYNNRFIVISPLFSMFGGLVSVLII